MNEIEGIPYITIYNVTARIELSNMENINSFCRRYSSLNGCKVAPVRVFGGYVWETDNFECILDDNCNPSSVRLRYRWFDGYYIKCTNDTGKM